MAESDSRVEVLGRLAALLGGRAHQRTLRVAIDGMDAAGKTTLSDELARTLRQSGVPVLRASIDGFHYPASVRHRRAEEQPARGYYEDSFDYPALRRLLLDPLGRSGEHGVRTQVFDFRSDRPIDQEPEPVQPGSVLLFDGVFLLRPELDGCWDLSIFLRVDPAISLERALRRDIPLFGTREATERLYRERYLPGQALYLSLVRPEQRAEVLIDNNNPAAPKFLRIPQA